MKFLDLFEDNTTFAEADIPDNFEVNPAQRTLADIGRKLMDKAATTKDDALSTALSRVGNELTSYGTVFGASNIQELEKKTGIKRDSIMKMMDYGKRMLNKEGAARIADKPVAEEVELDEGTKLKDAINLAKKTLKTSDDSFTKMLGIFNKGGQFIPNDMKFRDKMEKDGYQYIGVVNKDGSVSLKRGFKEAVELDEASKEGTMRVIDLARQNNPKVRKHLNVANAGNKGYQVQRMTKGKFVNQGKPYSTLKDAQKVQQGGQHSMQFETIDEAVGAASDAFYNMMDAMTGGQEPPEPFSTIIDEMTRYMSSDQLEDFVADFKRHHGINEAVHEASVCEDCGNPSYTMLPEEKQKGVDGKVCWKGYKRMGTKQKGGKTVDNCVKMSEAEDTTEYGIVRYPDTAISYIKKTTNGWEHIFDKSYGFRGPVDKADLTYAKKISREKVPSRLHQA